ncbi:MAG: YjjG family noncanonical pyrimidine nucleotidase [Clostridia bacterium]|nr:YjjG family noncanonical pyrimidine nucleotidase [Clostridia bacterium]
MIKTILWDVDGTLLDFDAAEKAAIRALFSEYALGQCTEGMLARYSEINAIWWQRLERKEITRKEVLVGRFEQFFEEYGIDTRIAAEFNEKYQPRLGETIVFRDDSPEIIKALKGNVKQYVVSNGTVVAQTKKLERSKLGEMMDGIFLSERIGKEKPDPAFFMDVFSQIHTDDLSTVMIVGDSLTSDIQGGMNAGIKTCWYNPGKKPVPDSYRVDYVISNLHELISILNVEN